MPTITYGKDTAPVLTPIDHALHYVIIRIIDGDPDTIIFRNRDDAMELARTMATENLMNDMEIEEIPTFDSIDDLLEFHNDHFRLTDTIVDVYPSRIY